MEKIIKSGRIVSSVQISHWHNGTTRLCSSSSTQMTEEEKEREIERIRKEASLDSPPTNCCQSGCANCVYIAWAEALSEKLKGAGPEISEKVLNMVEDPSMKAYIEMELRLRGITKK